MSSLIATDLFISLVIAVMIIWLLIRIIIALRFSLIFSDFRFMLFASKSEKYIAQMSRELKGCKYTNLEREVRFAAIQIRYDAWLKKLNHVDLWQRHPVLVLYAHIDLDLVSEMSKYYWTQIDLWSRNLITFGFGEDY